jgi:HEAT repeat protein
MEGLEGAIKRAPALGDSIVPVLAMGLTDDSPAVRHSALGALLHTANRDAVVSIPGLAGLLHDESCDVRCLAMTLFADAGEPVLDVLPAILENVGSSSSKVRQGAATTLGKIGALAKPEVVGALIDALDHETDFDVGGEIVKTLTCIEPATGAIEKYRQRKEAYEREEAEHESGGGGGSREWSYNGYESAGSWNLAGPPASGANDYSSHGM